MKVDCIEVSNFGGSIVASGLPMVASYYDKKFERDSLEIDSLLGDDAIYNNPHVKRAISLANTPASSGHCNFLSGISVFCNVTGTVKWWTQFQRYHFAQIISSQSTMHKLKEQLRKKLFKFNDGVSEEVINYYLDYSGGNDSIESLAYNCPMGLELTARVYLNYLQLKTIWNQRCRIKHRLKEWEVFGEFVSSLPLAKSLIIGD